MNSPEETAHSRTALIEKSVSAVEAIYDEMIRVCEATDNEAHNVSSIYRASALNLLHYLVLRRHDLRELQGWLAELGVSSLGRAEAHTMATLAALLTTLYALAGRPFSSSPTTSPAYSEGQKLLATHTQLLLGAPPHARNVHIMVTMPEEAATDYILVPVTSVHDAPQEYEAPT